MIAKFLGVLAIVALGAISQAQASTFTVGEFVQILAPFNLQFPDTYVVLQVFDTAPYSDDYTISVPEYPNPGPNFSGVFLLLVAGPSQSQPLVVGPGQNPTNATPLPAALPLFATGLGALGLLGWRKKRKAALAA